MPDVQPQSSHGAARALKISLALLLLICLVFRFYKLGTYPGINADEAQMGSEVLKFLNHEPYTFRTNSGLRFNPIFLVTESILLLRASPSFVLLRLPAALAGVGGIYLAYRLHRRIFGNAREAFTAAVLLACMPLAIAYGRMAWDSSFMFLTAPLVIYPAILIAKNRATNFDYFIFTLGCILCLTVHVTSIILLVACGLAIFYLRGWKIGLLLVVVLAATGFVGICLFTGQSLRETASAMGTTSLRLIRHPGQLIDYLGTIGRILSGARAYRYYAGKVPGPLLIWQSRIFLCGAIAMLVALWRRERFIALVCILIPFLLIAAAGRTMITTISLERYVLWLVPLFVILCARTLDARLIAVFCAVLLVQFYFFYFQPLFHLTNQKTLEATFWTADPEPKQQAAEIIRNLDPRGNSVVFAEDWWIEHSLAFLLHDQNAVAPARLPIEHKPGDFVVAFAGSPLDQKDNGHLVGQIIGANDRPIINIYRK